MPTNFQFNGALHVPPDSGVAACPIPMNMGGQFVAKTDVEFPLQGSGTVDVPLGGISAAGLKALLIKVDPTSDPTATPIVVKFNGHAKGEEISPGGFLALGSPQPKDGIKSIQITHTSNNVVKIWALG